MSLQIFSLMHTRARTHTQAHSVEEKLLKNNSLIISGQVLFLHNPTLYIYFTL